MHDIGMLSIMWSIIYNAYIIWYCIILSCIIYSVLYKCMLAAVTGLSLFEYIFV